MGKGKKQQLDPDVVKELRRQWRQETELEIAKHMDDIRAMTYEETFIGFLAVFCLVLHDKFGFGKRRLTVVVSYAVEMFNDIHDKRLTFNDAIEAIYRECRIDLRREAKG